MSFACVLLWMVWSRATCEHEGANPRKRLSVLHVKFIFFHIFLLSSSNVAVSAPDQRTVKGFLVHSSGTARNQNPIQLLFFFLTLPSPQLPRFFKVKTKATTPQPTHTIFQTNKQRTNTTTAPMRSTLALASVLFSVAVVRAGITAIPNTNTQLLLIFFCTVSCPDCTTAFRNAVASCDTTTGTCQFVSCSPGWWNVDNSLSNGCEYRCDYQADVDIPGMVCVVLCHVTWCFRCLFCHVILLWIYRWTWSSDVNYVDSNCDGIDGEIAKAVFVAAQGTLLSSPLLPTALSHVFFACHRRFVTTYTLTYAYHISRLRQQRWFHVFS